MMGKMEGFMTHCESNDIYYYALRAKTQSIDKNCHFFLSSSWAFGQVFVWKIEEEYLHHRILVLGADTEETIFIDDKQLKYHL